MSLFHLFHIVDLSPWPVLMGLGVLNLVFVMLSLMVGYDEVIIFCFSFVCVVALVWWRDVVRESTFQGYHSGVVVSGLMVGMVLFIVSEVFFFLSFFWSYFHSSLCPVGDVGGVWPSFGVESLDPFQVPLLNTVILLSSGVSVTWAHQALLVGNYEASTSLVITWMMGVYFLCLQMFEYYEMNFDISDSVFGSIFFMATGFHGFHVVVGTGFLMVMSVRCYVGHFSSVHHFGFEAAAWYWHFVDVVWLFLFTVVYWWGS